ncbi:MULTISPECIES: GNAT family N-acetyltransferase [unclassified Symbiopectobacterium]|uniref:GNAT family N-acetyltransferase n=1 Tax=unclassified Symbiopectobacterium TaxID=2794573 RepID=UPI002225F97E|nr:MULTISPECIES: GNAT family N-acetyltransferase [unclassified Symbiopectobacterium]MCW2473042.1 GNAT family N-acetyltransferase [Candidatus Symbiopectobacterium sp. NZEC151]MCW2483330.1 GNAT family N-acetyltransferase [Candidatus Symbiopectobacterium sp. NZEC135]
MLSLVKYDDEFLELSWFWLNDLEIKNLTMTPDFTREQQKNFYNTLGARGDYKIYGVVYDGHKIGAAGIKNIEGTTGEYWGYIGDKSYWGRGIGTTLIKEIIQVAQRDGMKKLTLKVFSTNQRAFFLYKKCGFVVDGLDNGIYKMYIGV